MVPALRRPIPARAQRVWKRAVCTCAIICFVRLALGGTVASYDVWQQGGFSGSDWVPIVSGDSSAVAALSMLNSAVPPASAVSTLSNGSATLAGLVYCDAYGGTFRIRRTGELPARWCH